MHLKKKYLSIDFFFMYSIEAIHLNINCVVRIFSVYLGFWGIHYRVVWDNTTSHEHLHANSVVQNVGTAIDIPVTIICNIKQESTISSWQYYDNNVNVNSNLWIQVMHWPTVSPSPSASKWPLPRIQLLYSQISCPLSC